tara:strand:+ start:726 stop:1145 length:420 start_codon:yes stop_codon:yes gene_type:complete
MSNGKIGSKVFDMMTSAADKTKVDFSKEMKFDPEGSGYDRETALELMELYPLTMPKPKRKGKYDREEVAQEKEAFQAWVWHKDEQKWEPHGGSLDPRTGMLLKGLKHSSINLTFAREEELGTHKFEFNPSKGRYFSVPK